MSFIFNRYGTKHPKPTKQQSNVFYSSKRTCSQCCDEEFNKYIMYMPYIILFVLFLKVNWNNKVVFIWALLLLIVWVEAYFPHPSMYFCNDVDDFSLCHKLLCSTQKTKEMYTAQHNILTKLFYSTIQRK